MYVYAHSQVSMRNGSWKKQNLKKTNPLRSPEVVFTFFEKEINAVKGRQKHCFQISSDIVKIWCCLRSERRGRWRFFPHIPVKIPVSRWIPTFSHSPRQLVLFLLIWGLLAVGKQMVLLLQPCAHSSFFFSFLVTFQNFASNWLDSWMETRLLMVRKLIR